LTLTFDLLFVNNIDFSITCEPSGKDIIFEYAPSDQMTQTFDLLKKDIYLGYNS